MAWRRILPAGIMLALAISAWGQSAGRATPTQGPGGSRRPPVLKVDETPYYTLHSDLGEADRREADLRMTRMYEEYQRRTKGFAGQVKPGTKFPFFLYRNEADYYAAGGPAKSAGVYTEGPDGGKLMAIAGPRTSSATWHVVQHEGFHQFASATIKNSLPIWVNEGLAEYFGEAIWTGDGFVSGLIPQGRLVEIRNGIKGGRFKPFRVMMKMTDQEWGSKLEYSNYDEAWAMVHFLANADDGRFQGPFVQFLTLVSTGTPAQNAWENVFGKNTDAFQAQFANWWMNLPDHPTHQGYLKVLVQAETSYLARAYLQQLAFPNAESFFKSYQPAGLTLSRDLWLPPSMFAEMSEAALRGGDWKIEGGNQMPRLILQDGDGTKYTGAFAINGGKVAQVAVEIIQPAGHAAPAGR